MRNVYHQKSDSLIKQSILVQTHSKMMYLCMKLHLVLYHKIRSDACSKRLPCVGHHMTIHKEQQTTINWFSNQVIVLDLF